MYINCDVQAVRLESAWSDRVRYMVVVYTNGRQDTEENILLGMDFSNKDRWLQSNQIQFSMCHQTDEIRSLFPPAETLQDIK